MALYKRGQVYHYRFRINGRRYRGSTKKTTVTAARRIEALAMARAEERGGVLLRRSPVLREFSKRFLEWVQDQSTLKQKSKDYYANGWRLLADTDMAGMRLDAISQDDAGVLSFPGGPSNHNNALRTLRRMLGKRKSGECLERLQRSNCNRNASGSASSMNRLRPSFCLFANSRFAMC